ncbi:MAG: phytanoyl-CoA dioxygenase family protein [Burkholderiales bacterium]|jgi:ectoine hydroxylase-related dioxygenase (phytanoyl-CoA dioxygenase family)
MTDELRTYGIKERAACSGPLDEHAQEIQLVGYTVVKDVVAQDELRQWRDRIDSVLERQLSEGGGSEAMRALGEAHTARALLAYDEAFLDLALRPVVLGICERLLGDYFVLNQQNAVVNPPAGSAHHQSAYHRDLPYQHFVASRPLAISALYCIDPFEVDTGGTLVLAGSHKLEAFPGAAVVERLERTPEAPAGACLVFDSMLYHRAGTNLTDRPRRAVNHVWSLPILKQQIVLKDLLRPGLRNDLRLRKLLGVESDPPRSVAEWIAQRRGRSA